MVNKLTTASKPIIHEVRKKITEAVKTDSRKKYRYRKDLFHFCQKKISIV
jgi:hypothetical protein